MNARCHHVYNNQVQAHSDISVSLKHTKYHPSYNLNLASFVFIVPDTDDDDRHDNGFQDQ